MADEAENLTLRILQELRADLGEMRTEARELRAEMHEMRTDLTQRIDGNTLLLNLIAGVTHDHEQRITTLVSR